MELEIISMTPQERMYSYSQSSQIEAQTGCIGHLRGDFGAGQEFFTSWFEHRGEYKTDEFMAEFDEVVNSLREKDELLFSRDSMIRYCRQRPEAEMVGNYCTEYGFKLKTDQHTYMLRCNPNYGDYNFYLYAYVGRFLEHHMEKAKQGIRFITPGYKEIFRIPDGDSIRIFTGGGGTRDRTCRFIDETHFETSGGYPSALYHICEFAERLEKTHGSVIPLRSSLPPNCLSILPSSGELIVITRGEKGYLPSDMQIKGKSDQEVAEIANHAAGVTKAQEAAMLAGSMFGWQTPAADPKNYDEQGQPTHAGRFTRPVPLWTVRPEYAPDIIEAMENSFGELEQKDDLGAALLSAAKNAVEDNIHDYLSELSHLTKGSFLEELDEYNVEVMYRRALQASIGYMLVARCGLDPSDYYEDDDFRDVLNFNTPETLNALGVAAGDISQMCLSEIARTTLALQRQPQKENRTFETTQENQYPVTEQKIKQPERSNEYGRDHIQQAGRLQPAESSAPAGAGSGSWEIRITAPEVPEGEPQDHLAGSIPFGTTPKVSMWQRVKPRSAQQPR